MEFLTPQIKFPDVSQASSEGLLAIGGDLSPERLLLAYKSGIFPWFDKTQPILWWSPDPRFVLFPENLKISKSMQGLIRKQVFKVSFNTCFERIINECAEIKREGQNGTWITEEMKTSYIKLHKLGYATSVEVWKDNDLVGGLYGVDLRNGIFCGESMFSKVSNASKFGFIYFLRNTTFKLIDCQVYTDHLASLGAEEIDRRVFLSYLNIS